MTSVTAWILKLYLIGYVVSLSDSYSIHRLLCIFPIRDVSFLTFSNDYVIESEYGILIELIVDDVQSFYI